MPFSNSIRFIAALTLSTAYLLIVHPVSAATLTFSSAVGGTIGDADSEGTGFTTRLAGTGSNLSNTTDTLLNLNTGAGTLSMMGVNSDLNSPPNGSNLANMEAPAILLSSLGFTGTQDFTVSAIYEGVPVNEGYEQFGVFVGTSGGDSFRGGLIFGNLNASGNVGHTYSARNVGHSDLDNNHTVANFPGATDTVQLTLSRIGGNFTFTMDNLDDASPAFTQTIGTQPAFLAGAGSFSAGIYVMDTTGGADSLTAVATEFSVTVLPEPAGLTLFAMGGLFLLQCRRRK